MIQNLRVLMVASENDSLPGTKVGGIGDVLRDLPPALNDQGLKVDTAIPSYGFLARLPGLEPLGDIRLSFAGNLFTVAVLKKPGDCDHYIFHHPWFFREGETVYYHDAPDRPFASDATRFAFFCACVAQALVDKILPQPDVIHCHDWHSAYLLVLLQYGNQYSKLRSIRTVYTIHNLTLQGIRPFTGDESSFKTWFPSLRYSIDKLIDPRYGDCVNPMRAAILLADYVHTVSPSYAQEILQASDTAQGIYGGEGLEQDLRQRYDQGRVIGILNGCYYDADADPNTFSKSELAKLMQGTIRRWTAAQASLSTSHWLAEKSILRWYHKEDSGLVITSVGRLTAQKVGLLQLVLADGHTVLDHLLSRLGPNDTVIILGSGDPSIEAFIREAVINHPQLIFLNGYSDKLSQALYRFGHLFLMPSSFEPCGISQMLAMRSGQPCLVNGVGGLKDTVKHQHTGFVFQGETPLQQAEALLTLFDEVLQLYRDEPATWAAIQTAAAAERFTWQQAAQLYIDSLYQSPDA